MKTLRPMSLVSLLILAAGAIAAAAKAPAGGNVAALVAELKGETEGAARSPADLEAAYAKVLNALLLDMASDDLGKRAAAQIDFSTICLRAGRPGAEAERAALCKLLLPKTGPQTTALTRAWFVRQLQWIGRAEAVPALAPLLNDQDPIVRDAARRALQANPSEEAGAALRAALEKADSPEWRVAVINALAARRDAAAVAAIAKCLADKDEAVARAAAMGLGHIGGPDAARYLSSSRSAMSPKIRLAALDAYLLCADRYVLEGRRDAAAAIYSEAYAAEHPAEIRVAALRGLVNAKGEAAIPLLTAALTGKDEAIKPIILPFVRDVPGPQATRALADLLPQLTPNLQAAMLTELGERADAAAKPAILGAVKSPDETIRLAALKAMGSIGDASDTLLLAKTAAENEGTAREAARASLDRLRGENVNAAIVDNLPKVDARTRAELVRSLVARRATAAVPALAKLAEDADAAVRTEALRGIEALGDESALGLLTGLIQKAQKNEDRDAAEKALTAVGSRAANKDAAADAVLGAFGKATGPAKTALLRALAGIGGPKALNAVRAALKDADAGVHDAALRTLADWPDGAVTDDLLALAKGETKSSNQVLALRGYIRLVGVGERKVDEKVRMYGEALAIARRPDEKRMILGPLADLGTVEALRLAAPLVGEKGLQEEAAQAAAKIARSVGGNLPEEFRTVLENIAKTTKNKATKKNAEDALKKFPKKQ